MTWTKERVEMLTKLDSEGLSMAQIAERLGDVSRNAVIGKLTRLRKRKARAMGTLPKVAQIKPDRTSKPYQSTRVKEAAGLRTAPKHTPRLPQVHLPALRSLEVPLVELEPGQCRYPTNDPAPFEGHLFCGHPAKEGSPYCACHHAVCFNGFSENRRAAA